MSATDEIFGKICLKPIRNTFFLIYVPRSLEARGTQSNGGTQYFSEEQKVHQTKRVGIN